MVTQLPVSTSAKRLTAQMADGGVRWNELATAGAWGKAVAILLGHDRADGEQNKRNEWHDADQPKDQQLAVADAEHGRDSSPAGVVEPYVSERIDHGGRERFYRMCESAPVPNPRKSLSALLRVLPVVRRIAYASA